MLHLIRGCAKGNMLRNCFSIEHHKDNLKDNEIENYLSQHIVNVVDKEFDQEKK